MTTDTLPHPFPDYVTCPGCGEPEVEVWCYKPIATCHACGLQFDHTLPRVCQETCDFRSSDGETRPECADQ